MSKQPIFNGTIDEYEKMSINDLVIQENILYDKYRMVREIRHYKELKQKEKLYNETNKRIK